MEASLEAALVIHSRLQHVPWFAQAARAGVILDSGVLLLHAFTDYERGRYLNRVSTDIPAESVPDLTKELEGLLRLVPAFTTPQAIAELQGLAETRVGLREERLGLFLRAYSSFRVQEIHVPYQELLAIKTREQAWNLSYTDTSVVVAGAGQRAPVLTMDRALRRKWPSLRVRVLHVYEDFFLQLS